MLLHRVLLLGFFFFFVSFLEVQKTYAVTATVRNDGMIIVNGTPRFLYGFYHDADDAAHQGTFLLNDLNTIADAGYNLMHPTLTELSNTTQYRQTAPTRGVWTVAQFYQPSLVSTVTTLKNDPSIFAWDIGDDFNMPLNDPNKTPAIYESKASQVRSIAPNHLTYGAGSGFPGYPLAQYKNAFNVFGIEAYPIGNKDGSFETEMEESISYYLYARQQLPDRAILALPQTFSWSTSPLLLPNAAEIRNMTYGALIARMNGVLHYSLYCCGTHVPETSMWTELQKLGADLGTLSNVMLSGTYSSYDEAPTTRTGSIHAGFWQYQGKTYVLIVNTAKASRSANIPLPAGVSGTLTPFFPGDTRYGTGLTVTNANITGSVGNYTVHAYVINGSTILPGDVNKDGRVDLLDFNIWRDEFIGTVTTKQSDLNADGKVDLLDFNTWLQAFKNPPTPTTTLPPTLTPTKTPTLTPTRTPTPTPTVTNPSGQAMPVGDLPGWKQIFTQDFLVAAPIGQFKTTYANHFTNYGDGWKTTASTYPVRRCTPKVVSATNGMMTYKMHQQTLTSTDQCSGGAAGTYWLNAVEQPAINGQVIKQLYGKYTIRFRVSGSLPGQYLVPLLWPVSEQWPRDGEIDFPEGHLDGNICAFMHHQDATVGSDQDAFCTTIPFASGWHTASTEWGPDKVSFLLDGNIIGISTNRLPNTTMRYVLQSETCIGGKCPTAGTSATIDFDWVVLYSKI